MQGRAITIPVEETRDRGRRRPLGFAEPGRFEIYCHESPPSSYPEEVHATLQVCVPFERASYAVTRQSETGRAVVQQLGARDAVVIPGGQPHAVDWRCPAHVLSLQLSESFLAEVVDAAPSPSCRGLTLRDPFLFASARQLRAVLEAEVPPSPLVVGALATAIAFRVGVARGTVGRAQAPAPRSLSAREVRVLREYVDAHLDQSITLSALAGLVKLSLWHFMRCFQATFGVAPHAFITQRRLDRARELLAASPRPIVDVALEVGMTHSHFSRTFLSRFGVSPREYRHRHRA